MKKHLPHLLALVSLVMLAGCRTSDVHGPIGHYSSIDDMGVFVFRRDGVFGYKFAAKVDFYDQANLPPNMGRWTFKPDGTLDIQLDRNSGPNFRIEWHPKDDAFDVIRPEEGGGLPMKAHYMKKE